MIHSLPGAAQVNAAKAQLLKKIDSLRHTSPVSQYFAGLYSHTTFEAIDFFAAADSGTRILVLRMDTRFARYFLAADQAFISHQAIPENWQSYYADTSTSPVRHLLLGINAHINGDIWQTLISEFTIEELDRLRSAYFDYYGELLAIYGGVYDEVLATSSRLRFVHGISFGLDRSYGRRMLKRWMKRQMRLADLYHSNPAAFQQEWTRLRKKMQQLDRLIEKNL